MSILKISKKVLFITSRVPAPLDDGWKIRTFHLMQGYVRNGWAVDLVSFCSPGQKISNFHEVRTICDDVQLVNRAKSYKISDIFRGFVSCKPFNVHNFNILQMFNVLKSVVEKCSYDLVQVEDVIMAQYVLREMGNAYRILDMHNVESNLMERYSDNERNFFKRFYAKITAQKLKKYEIAVASQFDRLLVCSKDDLNLLKQNGIQVNNQVVPNGVDCNYYQYLPFNSSSKDIVFVGTMNYHANISGVNYFVKDILPLILKKSPNTHFYIVGKSPTKSVCDLCSSNVTVTGTVSDVREYLRKARVVVAPLLVGGGTRLKILEAMACSRPVVSTSIGAEGIGAEHGRQIMLADSPDEFAHCVLTLLDNSTLCEKLGRNGCKFVVDEYNWIKITDSLCKNLLV
jgi:sugar transferase (PEP-CTERM/EpsH1 system associated)